MTASEVGARIRRLRLANGLEQVQFAAMAGLGSGNSAVSMLENGRMPLTADLLHTVAAALGCSTDFLSRPGTAPLTTQPLLRAYADAPKKEVNRQLADATLAVEAARLLALTAIPDTLPTFHGDLADDHEIEQFALDVRAAAHLEDGDVVANTIRAAERLGCLVLPMPDELGRHLGMSVRIDATPVLCVSRAGLEAGVPGDRQRFTVVHELGHLGLHSHLGAPQTAQDAAQYEKQAHRFAGAFLAPGDAMMEELKAHGGRVTLQTLTSIKGRWGIAIKALVMRFHALGVIDADHARSLYKQISARGWNKGEPVPVGGESAIWLERAIDKRFAADGDRINAAATTVGLDRRHLERWAGWTSAPVAEVVELAPRRRHAEQALEPGRAAAVMVIADRRR